MAVKAKEQITVSDISDAYSVTLTSEAYTFVGNTTGAPSGLSCTTQAVVYCGSTQCTKVNITQANITCPTGITAKVTNDGTASPTVTFTTTATITGSCEATIPVVVDGVTINKKFSFSVAKQGPTGSAGKGIKSTAITYQASTSGTTAPTGAWNTSVPSVPQGQYLWSRTVITYTDNSTSTTYSVAYIPKNGQNGATGSTGATGTGVTSIVQQYYLSNSKTTQTGSSWGTTMPTWSSGKYLWTRYAITYKNPTSTSYTSPICDSSWEAVNEIQVGGRNYVLYGKGNVKNGFFTNFTNVENGYGEHTLSSAKQYAVINLDNGFAFGCRDYEVGKNITWSYDIMYTVWDFPEGATCREWCMGQRYSIDITGSGVTDGEHRVVTYHSLPRVGSNGCELNEWYHVEKIMTIPTQAAEVIGTQNLFQFYNSNADVTATISFRIKNIKLEYGNKATDWTPAPEDVDESIGNAQDTADNALSNSNVAISRLNVAELTIDAIDKSISSLVTDENGGSLMTQGPDGWTFNISSIQKNVENAVDQLNSLTGKVDSVDQVLDNINSLANDLSKKTAYINMTTDENGSPCIELGKQDNEFKVRITNTSIDFIQGVTKVAYFNNHSLYIRKSIINDELQIGEKMGFIWKRRGSGNMGLRWIGG